MKMQAPTWLKPAIMGAIVGGAVTMIVGFNYGGWYLGRFRRNVGKQAIERRGPHSARSGLCQSVASGSGRRDQTEGVRRHKVDIRAAGLRHEGRLGDDAEGGGTEPGLGVGLRRRARQNGRQLTKRRFTER